jgi:DNA-binding transcriptional ArsR family regulator
VEDSAATLVRLLDIQPELGTRLREDDRAEARDHLVLRTLVLPKGEWSLEGEAVRAHPFGVIVIDGVLLQDVQLGARSCQQLLGPGDVVLPDAIGHASLDVGLRLAAATESRVAVLDDRLQGPFRLWPGLAIGMLERIGRQLSRNAVHGAIAQLPRVEDRLEATFWDLADRWGRVTPNGVHVPLQLTHETLARIVGGRRPTITLALRDLSERGIVVRHRDGTWMIAAREPTLSRSGQSAAPPPVIALADAPAAFTVIEHRPWMPDARAEMLATADRAKADHAAVATRVNADQERYARTREQSRLLRDRAIRDREARAANRAERSGPLSAPAAPSAG